jgi:cold shock CspA family protein
MTMKLETGTVKFFNNKQDKLFGFLLTPEGDVFFHLNNRCAVHRSKAFDEPVLIDYDYTDQVVADGPDLRMPKQGDKLMFQRGVGNKGPKALKWAFEDDYKRAQLTPGIPSTDVNAPPCEDFTWDELEAVTDGVFGLMQCIPAASKQLDLSNRHIGVFLRNTPGGKRGEELWKEFRRRQADKGSDEYSFVTFMREVLSQSGCPVDDDFDPDND